MICKRLKLQISGRSPSSSQGYRYQHHREDRRKTHHLHLLIGKPIKQIHLKKIFKTKTKFWFSNWWFSDREKWCYVFIAAFDHNAGHINELPYFCIRKNYKQKNNIKNMWLTFLFDLFYMSFCFVSLLLPRSNRKLSLRTRL